MSVLVYGAGVIGSYLTHVLQQGGNEVTVLARGKRADVLEREGLVIRHYVQRKTTVDRIRVIRALDRDDQYDLIFVVMKYTDFQAVLQRKRLIAKSRKELRKMQLTGEFRAHKLRLHGCCKRKRSQRRLWVRPKSAIWKMRFRRCRLN